MKTPLSQLNAAGRAEFVVVCGPLFEHSPWIAERTFDRLSRSPGTSGEGRGEGDFARQTSIDGLNHPHPNPLPDYRERETDGALPFSDVAALHAALCETMYAATTDEQVCLIAAHPDLVGRLARQGRLTRESTQEQAAAGLGELTTAEAEIFERCNADYRQRFGFPFVICARENKKATILAAFPIRLHNTREQEIQTALAEIAKIARLRLFDAVSDE